MIFINVLFLPFFFALHSCIEGHTYGYSTKKIPKYNEDLDRGVVAIISGSKEAFISWRFLITDDDNIKFNLYREELIDSGSLVVKLNNEPISNVTYFRDKTLDRQKAYMYFVGSIINSEEVENSTKYLLKAKTPSIPCYKIPIRGGCPIRTVWPGDLNGDGKFDFVVARNCDYNQIIEGYLSNGSFLWEIDLGHNSVNHNNIRPGATTINVGHWDGVNVYDLDGDGKSEVFIRIANNVTFGDGYVFLNEGHPDDYANLDKDQWIAVVDGMSGKLRAKAPIPSIYIEHGAMAAQFGVGYPDGIKPSLISVMKNRDAKNYFHLIVASYSFNKDSEFVLDWYFTPGPNDKCPDGHHFRIADVDMDGKDEIHEIGFTLNGDGTLRYDLGPKDIHHGDRFYVGRYNKEDKVMMGYGIQQLNPTNLTEYYYDASSGEVIWRHFLNASVDVGRGNVGDFDPNHPGYEVYSFYGLFNAKTNEKIAEDPAETLWPSNNIYWDGTLVPSCIHRGLINKWNAEKKYADRILSAGSVYNKIYGEYFTEDDTYPLFHGDIIGDWREEFIVTSRKYDELIVFTSNFDTQYRITSLSQDPGMRNSMTLNGYKQSHMPLMYFATDMDIDKERQFIKSYLAARAMKSDPDDGGKGADPNKGGLRSGIIAAIVICVIVVVAAVVAAVVIILKKKNANGESVLLRSIDN